MRIDDRTEVLTPEGFLADIIANPAGDTLRLIYADWLDEHNDPRGEFIRVQCKLAKMGECQRDFSLGLSCCCRFCNAGGIALRRRERELLKAHGRAWASAVLPWWSAAVLHGIHDQDYVFRRGFVSGVLCTQADWCGKKCAGCPFVKWGMPCSVCHGTGRVGAHGPVLVRAAPLERATLAGREPADFGYRGQMVYQWDCWGDLGDYPWYLEELLFNFLPGGDCLRALGARAYPSRETALDALSGAALAWARAQPLKAPP